MQTSRVLCLFFCLTSVGVASSAKPFQGNRVAANGVGTYKADCQLKRRVSLADKNPGAGLNVKDVFTNSHKDGYYAVDCIKDSMFYSADKFGDHKHAFNGIKGANSVSIVHYDAHVAKEDGKQMTHEVCFDFCRSIPNMLYFGLTNGRGCYCTPYFDTMAGDSSECDAVCPGDASTMCGGKTKSSIFEMHSCDDTADVFANQVAVSSTLSEELGLFNHEIIAAADGMNTRAGDLQKSFGAAGDPAAADLMQQAKVWAGEVQHASEASIKLCNAAAKTSSETPNDFKSFEGIDKAEKLIDAMEHEVHEMEGSFEAQQRLFEKLKPSDSDYLEKPADAGKQYYEAMYFVDKEQLGLPSTCSGDLAADPIYDRSFDACAMACDAKVKSCVGFSFFKGEQNLCFLFSKFSTVTYYTGCDQKSFLQKANKEPKHGDETMCFAKLQNFEGTTLKPNPSGKCEQCLKKVTGADRCFK